MPAGRAGLSGQVPGSGERSQVTRPFTLHGAEIDAEAEAARAAEHERQLLAVVEFYGGRLRRCCRHARALEEEVSELSLRPPLKGSIRRRLRYLFLGR